MITIDSSLSPATLLPQTERLWQIAAPKISRIAERFPHAAPSPVITKAGRYEPQGWTEWTRGFQYGSALLAFDATGDESLLAIGRDGTRRDMASHVTHFGVHDHGFNNVSTYGNMRRLILEGRLPGEANQLEYYDLALKASAAVQASRWSRIENGGGHIYSFNGPHSLFSDTMRSLRVLAIGHLVGAQALGENDAPINMLDRLVKHAQANATYNVYFGEGRDAYDLRGRVVHESIFNVNDGRYRCPSTQQGYSPFTTWTRGLAWVMLGYAEQLEFLDVLSDADLAPHGGRGAIETMMLRAARATCDFFIEQTPTDGIAYWDTGAPGLVQLGDYLDRPADPFNAHEPVDSSASAIACQGLLRLGRRLQQAGEREAGDRYWAAGLTTLRSLLQEPYLATDPQHDGLLLHTIYHRPRNWDYTPPGSRVPHGEACMWGDYHLLEAALYVSRLAKTQPYYAFHLPLHAG
ncbi:glycoside hydrolase family 88 protein [Lacipirellula parvula]|uniref:Hydrolase n=1 Tax=Lacipirellula parvula TaxID=2650471 RepID=A0A5K7XLV1_9BACT|nr:glycoside hydrolase family 88 protein [Lacipirellula parvula]BBO35503.1 hydrolase [Lacipirellula parvula]